MKRIVLLVAALLALPVAAQNTITLTPSVTSGDGTITTALSWSTNPPLTAGTPCTASGHPSWTGPKAGSGSQSITIDMSGSFTIGMACGFPGSSIVEYSWTPPTTNTDTTSYTNRDIIRIKQTFAAALSAGASCSAGETCTDVDDSGPARPTMRTVTGITQTGTLRATAFARNSVGVFSDPSNVVTKVFTGTVNVTQSVLITVNPKPSAPGNFAGL
jgi:hypothetical protein